MTKFSLNQVGSSTDCGKVICCSSKDPPPKNIANTAGTFGDYKCDLPLNTLEILLQHAKNHHPEIEYIFLTGDYPAHDVWRQDRMHNLESASAIVQAINDHFPSTKVFPALGNHEIFPVNMFPTEDEPVPKIYDPSWLYNRYLSIVTDFILVFKINCFCQCNLDFHQNQSFSKFLDVGI